MNNHTFTPGQIVTTDVFGARHVGRVLYVMPARRLVVADWKAGDDITRNVSVFQAGVAVDAVSLR